MSGTTPFSFCLTVFAAESTSSHVFGCHGTVRPAFLKSCLLYQSARVSVPIETPYVLPSSPTPAGLALPRNWLVQSSGARYPAATSDLTWKVSS